MTNNRTLQRYITIQGQKLKTVDHFKYIGAIICDEGSRIALQSCSNNDSTCQTKNHLERQEYQNKHKIRLMRALVITIFMYACETWTLTAELHRRIQSLEFTCFRKILGISYKDRNTNEQVRKTIIKHIGPYTKIS